MKKFIFFTTLILLAYHAAVFSQDNKNDNRIKNDTISADSLEYQLVIIDPGFETWLVMQPPMNFYSNDYYASKNRLYVSEWNQRYNSGTRRDLYNSYIDYNPTINYPVELNYKLYYYFRYFEEKNRVKLING